MDTRTREIHALSLSREEALADYRLAYQSRQLSLIGRREVLTGKAKFGIFGDGKEVAQLAMAKAFQPGDMRSGYYRDQTFMLATGMVTLEALFAQLYAIPDVDLEPASAGRQMNAHFATRVLDEDGAFMNLAAMRWSTADTSPTASQMPRLVGLAYASRLYRDLETLNDRVRFSQGGNEIAFGTIGNASCAEGPFWESINAVGVLRAPLLMSIWDDEYGISVPNEQQITKGDLSAVLSGFRRGERDTAGYDLYTVKGWDYPDLCQTYQQAAAVVREDRPGDRRLVAYVVPSDGAPAPASSGLRAFLEERLPEAMVPAIYVVLSQLPLTPNGKVDRSSLPEPSDERPELRTAYEAPRSQWERRLATLWSEFLGFEEIGIHDDFLELGGHSLLAAQVSARVRQSWQRELSLVDIFEQPTVAQLAEILQRQQTPDPVHAVDQPPSHALDPERGFREMGLDSLMTVVFRNRLSKILKCTLPATLAFNYPNLNALTDFLMVQLLPESATTENPNQAESPLSDEPFPSVDTADLEGLNSDKLADMIEDEFSDFFNE